MAGEIQLNSTTMATESSGSITAQLDTIRPNTTNGSLTLQGDSSDAGVTGLTIDSSGNATFAGTIKSDTIKPKTTDASLTLQGDSSGSGVTGITIDSSGVVNTTTAKVTNIQATSGQSLTIKDEDGNTAITVGTDNTAHTYLSLNFGSYHGDSGGAGSGTLSGNTLSDYEFGTWTPILSDGTNDATTNSNGWTHGNYVKIGKMIWIQGTMNTSSLGSVSGDIRIRNLPFTANPSYIFPAFFFGAQLNLAGSYSLTGRVVGNADYINLSVWDSTSGVSAMQHSEWGATGYVNFSTLIFE